MRLSSRTLGFTIINNTWLPFQLFTIQENKIIIDTCFVSHTLPQTPLEIYVPVGRD